MLWALLGQQLIAFAGRCHQGESAGQHGLARCRRSFLLDPLSTAPRTDIQKKTFTRWCNEVEFCVACQWTLQWSAPWFSASLTWASGRVLVV